MAVSPFTMETKGLQEAKKRLRKILVNCNAMQTTVGKLGTAIEKDALALTPMDTGALRSTVRVQFRRIKKGSYYLKATAGGMGKFKLAGMSMGRYVDYAAERHEVEAYQYTTAGTGSKFIEKPFREHTERFLKTLNKLVTKK